MEKKEEQELRDISLAFRKWWSLDRKGLADMEREFVEDIGGLIYELGYRLEQEMADEYDFGEWINGEDNTHELSMQLTKIKSLIENYNKIFHILDTTVAFSDSGLNKDTDIKLKE